ncbi:MAG: hypothetical protein V1736_06510 [Pseudomonadota bacterium]
MDRFPEEGVFESYGRWRYYPHPTVAGFTFLKTLDSWFEGCQDKRSLEKVTCLTDVSTKTGEKDPLLLLKMDHARAVFVQPDEGAVCVGCQDDAEGQGTEIDELAPGEESALCETRAGAPAEGCRRTRRLPKR